jgi:two-component system OmpR family response regulator
MSPKVLIVEDDPGTADIYARILRFDNYDVRTALDAETAWRLAVDERPAFDAMIVDLRMPAVDGVSLLRQIRESSTLQATPVAIVTGDYFVSSETSAELKRLGGEIRFKPLWAEDLIDLTRRLLEPHRLG